MRRRGGLLYGSSLFLLVMLVVMVIDGGWAQGLALTRGVSKVILKL